MQIGASTGSELGSFCAWSGSELGSTVRGVDRSLDCSNVWLRRVQIVLRQCVDRFVWLGVWVGAVKLCVHLRKAVHVREEWKMFEVKIWAENDFRWFWLILRSN